MPTTAPDHSPRFVRNAARLLAIVAILATTGCLRITGDLTLNPDDTVSGTYTYAVSSATAEELAMPTEDLAAELGASAVLDTFAHATSTPFEDGDLQGLTVTFTDEPLSSFNGSLPDGITITHTGEDFILDAPTLGDLSPEDAATLEEATLTLTVTFPGGVSEHNGTLSGTTVTWDLTTATEAPHAQGSASARSLPWGIIGGGILVAAAAVSGFVLLRRRRAQA